LSCLPLRQALSCPNFYIQVYQPCCTGDLRLNLPVDASYQLHLLHTLTEGAINEMLSTSCIFAVSVPNLQSTADASFSPQAEGVAVSDQHEDFDEGEQEEEEEELEEEGPLPYVQGNGVAGDRNAALQHHECCIIT
jgi:ribosomal protein L12E/L44/L45/RPP1/RPP2